MFYRGREYGAWLYAVIAVLIIALVALPSELKPAVICVALIMFGLAQLERPAWLVLNSRRIKREWTEVKAAVIRVEYEPKQRHIHIEMDAADAEGMRIPFIRRSWCWLLPIPRIGKTMTIRYDRARPTDFLVKPEYIFMTVCYLLAAFVTIAAGAVGLLRCFWG